MNEINKQTIKDMVASLGGNRACIMTGGSFSANYEESILYFKYKGSKHSNCLTINYDEGQDLFDLKFQKIRSINIKDIDEFKGIYIDQVKRIFEDKTKLALSI